MVRWLVATATSGVRRHVVGMDKRLSKHTLLPVFAEESIDAISLAYLSKPRAYRNDRRYDIRTSRLPIRLLGRAGIATPEGMIVFASS